MTPMSDNADLSAFEERSREDKHQFRFIVSPEGAERLEREPRLQRQRLLLGVCLQCLQRMGLTGEMQTGVWAVHSEAEPTLRAMGERGDIIRTIQWAMSGKQRI